MSKCVTRDPQTGLSVTKTGLTQEQCMNSAAVAEYQLPAQDGRFLLLQVGNHFYEQSLPVIASKPGACFVFDDEKSKRWVKDPTIANASQCEQLENINIHTNWVTPTGSDRRENSTLTSSMTCKIGDANDVSGLNSVTKPYVTEEACKRSDEKYIYYNDNSTTGITVSRPVNEFVSVNATLVSQRPGACYELGTGQNPIWGLADQRTERERTLGVDVAFSTPPTRAACIRNYANNDRPKAWVDESGVERLTASSSIFRLPSFLRPPPVPVTPPTPPPVAPQTPPTPSTVPRHKYLFLQGVDSAGNDITDQAEATRLANNIPELQRACDANPACVGFNTNGWRKGKLQPPQQWYRWSEDATRGMYVKQGLVASSSGAQVALFDRNNTGLVLGVILLAAAAGVYGWTKMRGGNTKAAMVHRRR